VLPYNSLHQSFASFCAMEVLTKCIKLKYWGTITKFGLLKLWQAFKALAKDELI